MEKRRKFKPEEKTLTEIAAKYEVHPNQLSRWKVEFLQNAGRAFNKEKEEENINKVGEHLECCMSFQEAMPNGVAFLSFSGNRSIKLQWV
jgi:hypothetical protein